jgi:hypothetical protein
MAVLRAIGSLTTKVNRRSGSLRAGAARLWTRDKRLAAVAADLKLACAEEA